MADAQFDFINERFPEIAKAVRHWAKVKMTAPDDQAMYATGWLNGLAETMIATGICSEAYAYIRKAEEEWKR